MSGRAGCAGRNREGRKRMDMLEILRKRRSIRKYTGEPVPEEALEKVLAAGLLSASSKGRKPWEFIVVRDRERLKRMSRCRVGAAGMLEGADCAVVVIGDEQKSDVWIEDCTIAMSNMHTMAASLGLGSCWIQGRSREAAEGGTTEDFLRTILKFPENFRLEAILSLGMPAVKPAAYELETLPTDKVHREFFGG